MIRTRLRDRKKMLAASHAIDRLRRKVRGFESVREIRQARREHLAGRTKPFVPTVAGRSKRRGRASIVARTAGLLRGRVPSGRVYQRRLRQEWERRFARETR